jgi:LuxR family maltose regulon positive regulatory protein
LGSEPHNPEFPTLLRTKLHRPQVTENLVARPRLLEYLHSRRQRPLTLVSAGAGYGKTTLVSSWLEEADWPSAWLSLDQYDDDLAGFLTYFVAAVQTIFPEAGQETLALLIEQQRDCRGTGHFGGYGQTAHPQYAPKT